MDTGSGINLIYAKTLRAMHISLEFLKSTDCSFHGIVPGSANYPLGRIALNICFRNRQGLLGHSSLVCPTLADRDAEGKLPYNGDKLSVPDRKKKEAGPSNVHSYSSKHPYTGSANGSGNHSFAQSSARKENVDG
jgi:hypothetical protein